ncbi:MAG: NAD+ synthase [Calditrichaeota bacterium]|nr:NAD+ synthase [Calditrichota bacterium]
MKIALAQMNPIVGDVEGNLEKMRNTLKSIEVGSADLLVFPELFLCGYPPNDLLNLPGFIDRLERALDEVSKISIERSDIGILFGTVIRKDKATGSNKLYNAALLYENGNKLFVQCKQLLPTYDVFDENRYFQESITSRIYKFRGVKLGISICEDAWNDPDFETEQMYETNPIAELARDGAELMINISASPYHLRKEHTRFNRYVNHARKLKTPMVIVGQVGANDELIFDGGSMVIDAHGKVIVQLTSFKEKVQIVDTDIEGTEGNFQSLPDMESLRQALALGIRDYLAKCGFNKAVIGLSGGIDSALTTCLAVDAIGSENVHVITMPSKYSSTGSINDSLDLSRNLGISCDTVPIDAILSEYISALGKSFSELKQASNHDVTKENLQARIRGNLLMAYSNRTGAIVLATGNKSELSVGYCTLYGDMCGGLAVISDLPKKLVYELAAWYNRDHEVIPQAILDKPPSAELAPNQKDQDTLPPYDILDGILEMYLENYCSKDEIIKAGYDAETVDWVIKAIDRSEFKRKQAAPGLRVTTKAFGKGWRMPIAAKNN